MTDTKPIRRITVVGTGVIGASWSALFLANGLEVVANDVAATAEASLRKFVASAWPALERLGLAPGASPDNLAFTTSLEKAVEGTDFVQENGPERIGLKQSLYEHLDGLLPPAVIIASSSSGLPMSQIQAGARAHPERCVIGHPFNPPHLMPLVEVVGGVQTAPEVVGRALAIYTALGKRPIHVRREVKGHIGNRLQWALWREAVHLVAEGVATVSDIDAAISEGPGIRWALMGQHLVYHLGGGTGGMKHFLDQFAGPIQDWWEDLGRPQLTPLVRQRLIDGITAEVAGRRIEDSLPSAIACSSKSWH